MRTTRRQVIAIATLAVVAAGGCRSGGSGHAKTAPTTIAPAKVHTVPVTVTAQGCTPQHISTPAGPTTFVVTNANTPGISEVVILDATILVAEVEHVVPGSTKSFSVTLQPGHYLISCAGGALNGGQGTLDVTGDPVQIAKADATARATAVDTYRSFIEGQAQTLVELTTAFVHAVEAAGSSPSRQALAQIKTLYETARPPYERIEPVAATFGDLDRRIDARINDVAKGRPWTGFHRLEQALYEAGALTGMRPIAEQLLADVTTLEQRVTTVRLEPATIANGAVELLNDVTATKITGEEERYSHIDLVDLAANVSGSRAAFDAVAPLLPATATVSAAQIDGRFDAVAAALKPFRRGDGFVLYSTLTPAQTRAIAQSVEAVAEPLSRVAEFVVR